MVWSQPPEATHIDPRVFGFNIPPGPVTPGGDRRVATRDESGNAVIGKLHAQVGSTHFVVLPDGHLVARPSSDSTVTERDFRPATMDEIAERLTSTALKGFKTKQTRHYLYVYNTSDKFAKMASSIMDSMFRGVNLHAKAQKISIHDPFVPLIVIMFRSEFEFRKFLRTAPGIVAYYNVLTNHVVMYEPAPARDQKRPDLAIKQAISTIAHEGAHQILHNIGVQQRLSVWPMWLAEGLAEYFAPTTMGESRRGKSRRGKSEENRWKWKGAGHVNDLRMFELEEYLKQKSTDGLDGTTIEQTAAATRLTSAGYASAWALTHFLAKNDRANFNRFVNRMSRVGPFEIAGDNLTMFTEHFGSDLPALEKRLVAHLQKQEYLSPFSSQPHFVVRISYVHERKSRRDASMFLSHREAERWRRSALSKLAEEERERAESMITRHDNRSAASLVLRRWLDGR